MYEKIDTYAILNHTELVYMVLRCNKVRCPMSDVRCPMSEVREAGGEKRRAGGERESQKRSWETEREINAMATADIPISPIPHANPASRTGA